MIKIYFAGNEDLADLRLKFAEQCVQCDNNVTPLNIFEDCQTKQGSSQTLKRYLTPLTVSLLKQVLPTNIENC